MNRPIVILTLLWVMGSILALNFPIDWLNLTTSLILLLTLSVLFYLRPPAWLPICAFFLVAISAGYFHWNDQRNGSALQHLSLKMEDLSGSEITLKGTMESSAAVDGDKASFKIQAREITIQDQPAVQLRENMQVSLKLLRQEEQGIVGSWKRGDTLTLQGVLRLPSPARNFGGFDYQRYLRLQHIHWLVTVKGTDQVQVESIPFQWRLNQLFRWNDELRKALSNRMDSLFSNEQAGFMKSMLIGETDDLIPDQFQQFSQLGLTHILAISGLNVAVFLAICIWIMKKAGLTKETYLLVSMWLLPFYILVTGAAPSILRAGLMAMIALYGTRRGLAKDALHLACFVGWGMLLWNPYFLLDVSFQLSFLVTIGLILGVTRVSRLLPFSSTLVKNTLSITIVSQLISFPISIYYFNQYSLLSWLANSVLVPVFSLIIFPAGLAALAAGIVYVPLGQAIGWPIETINSWIFHVIEIINRWKLFQLIWPSPSIGWIAIYYGLLLLIYWALYQWRLGQTANLPSTLRSGKVSLPIPETLPIKAMLPANAVLPTNAAFPVNVRRIPAWIKNVRFYIALSISGLGFLLYYGYTPDRWSRVGQVQFIDVGQGDCILIRTPSGKHVLVDGGGTLLFRKPGEEWKNRKDPYEVGQKLLVPLLKKRGIHHLDAIYLSHEDTDHSGGLQAVVEQIPVKQFVFNGTLKPNPGVEKLFRSLLERNIPLLSARTNGLQAIDSRTHIQVLYPFASDTEGMVLASQQNILSIVFLLEMDGVRFLFTGDMVKNTEDMLLERLKSTPIPTALVDVLKVAHHGSKTSTIQAWLDFWKPKAAVISVGEMNSYGHPSKEVLDRLERVHTSIYRTDNMGEVQMVIEQGVILTRTKLGKERNADP